MMKNWYYLIWVDSIVGFRNNNPTMKDDWKFNLFVTNTMCNALNLFSIIVLLDFIGIKIRPVEIDLIPVRMLNGFLGFVINYAAIFILLNYFLIFRKGRYRMLIKKYPNKNGKLSVIYGLSSVGVGFILIILYGILR